MDLAPDSIYEPYPNLGRSGMRTKVKYSFKQHVLNVHFAEARLGA